jgi:hypothetical protein
MLTIRRAKITKLKGMLINVIRLHTNILDYIVQMESILKHIVVGTKIISLVSGRLAHPWETS